MLLVNKGPLGAPTRIWMMLELGALQLMVVTPAAFPVTGIGLGEAVMVAPSLTAAAPDEVTMLPLTPLGKKPPPEAFAAL